MARAYFGGLVAFSMALLLGTGCGDDSEDESSGTGGATTGGTGGITVGGSGGGSGTGASGGTGGVPAGGGGTSASGGSGGSSGAGSGGIAGAGGSAGGASGGSAGTTASGGTGGGSGQSIACGTKSCALPGSYCCNHPNQPDECLASATSCTFGVEMKCDGPEDCGAGEVCCGAIFVQGQNISYTSTACAATCSGKNARVVCGSSGKCPTGLTCGTSELLPPYLDCK